MRVGRLLIRERVRRCRCLTAVRIRVGSIRPVELSFGDDALPSVVHSGGRVGADQDTPETFAAAAHGIPQCMCETGRGTRVANPWRTRTWDKQSEEKSG